MFSLIKSARVLYLSCLLIGLAACNHGGGGSNNAGPSSIDLWTWLDGESNTEGMPNYGTKAIVSPDNIPGARMWHAGCADSTGNTWIFGGYGVSTTGSGSLNDLWKFDGGSWTWITGSNTTAQAGEYGTKGTAASANTPGSRYSARCVIDSNGDLWLWGGLGYDSVGSGFVHLSDLWKFDGSQWTWIAGSNTGDQAGVYGTIGVAAATNTPGGREGARFLIDSNDNLWVYAGYGYDNAGTALGYLNDLWRYDGTQWTWVSGSNTADQTGSYVQTGADPGNMPGGRNSPAAWIDNNDLLWVFGGSGFSQSGLGLLNDLWKFDGTNWSWIAGSNTISQPGTYGSRGTAATGNLPGSRYYATLASDDSGNVWLFGGEGYDSATTLGYLNDLWFFDGNNWTWVSGANTAGETGSYGTMGTAAAANHPGYRRSASAWIDYQGNFRLFGGGYVESSTYNKYNDLWRYQP